MPDYVQNQCQVKAFDFDLPETSHTVASVLAVPSLSL